MESSADIPHDWSRRIRQLRSALGLTQTRLASYLGVSFASVNRWERERARPSALAWRQILQAELEGFSAFERDSRGGTDTARQAPQVSSTAPEIDFHADPHAVWP